MNLNTEYNLKRVSIYDSILILVILLISFVSILTVKSAIVSRKKAVVYYDGDFLQEIDLSKNKIYDLHLYDESSKMQIEVKAGGARVIKTSCPNKLCRNMRVAGSTHEAIICVPNKVIIKKKALKSKKEVEPEYDAISY